MKISQHNKENVEPVFAMARMSVREAAKLLGMDCQTVRVLLQNNLVSWGQAVKLPGSSHFTYLIYRKSFYEQTGCGCGGETVD